MSLIHYKQKVIDSISYNNNPQNWRLYELLNNKEVKLTRLLKDMVREGLITIHYETEANGKVRRILTKVRDCYDDFSRIEY
jgi:hypothetical protein